MKLTLSLAVSLAAATLALAQVPAGTVITVKTIDRIDSREATLGQTFRASLDEALRVDGREIAPRGADVVLKLMQTQSSGALTGSEEVTVSLESVKVGERMMAVRSDTVTQAGEGKGKSTAKKGGLGALAGGVIGGVVGGGKGAAIGAAAGGTAGVALSSVTKGPRVTIPSETRLAFTVAQ